jgi:hypothetical protein
MANSHLVKSSREARRGVRPRRLMIDSLEPRQLLAVDLELLKDISALPTGSSPYSLVDVNGVAFLVATTPAFGFEL